MRGRATSDSISFTWKVLPRAGVAGDCDLAAHGLRQHLGDGQAEAGAGLRAAGPCCGALERLEDALEVGGMNADAGVLDLEPGDLVAVAEPAW